jgi:DNA (cytosine-5)-methyltransferase 1
MGRQDFETETLLAVGGSFDGPTRSLRADGFDASEDGTGRGTPLVPVLASTLKANNGGGGFGSDPSETFVPVAFSCKDHGSDAGSISPTLRSMGHDGSHANAGVQVAVCFDTTQITSPTCRSNPLPGDPCHPLSAEAHVPAIAYRTAGDGAVYEEGNRSAPLTTATDPCTQVLAMNLRGRDGGAMPEMDHLASLRAASGGSSRSYVAAMAVRRLMPRECERLQGVPDDFTRIPGMKSWRALDETETPEELRELGLEVRENKAGEWRVNDPDGPRYKILGNSMAVPVMRWIGKRIEMVEELCGAVLS